MPDRPQRIRVTLDGRELPVEDMQDRVVAALVVGGLVLVAILALPWLGW